MIMQVALISVLSAIFLYALSQRKRSPPVAVGIMVLNVAGVLFVVFPDTASRLAHFVGVGRGADLVLYCFVTITLFVLVNLHLRLRSSFDDITVLAREIALASAQRPPANKEHPCE